MARKIVFTSGKGGVGKTTICANLGINLSSLGFRTLLIDCDIGLNNLDVVLCCERQVVFDLADVVSGKCRARQAIVQVRNIPSLFILASSSGCVGIKITGENIKQIVDNLDHSFDYILIDCPAGVDEGFARAVIPATEAIVVVTPHMSSLKDADKVVSLLKSYKLDSIGLVINRMRGDMLLSGQMPEIESIVHALGVPLLGVIPEDDEVSSTSATGVILATKESARAFTLLSENIHDGTKKIFDCTFKYRGIMGYFKRNIKKRV